MSKKKEAKALRDQLQQQLDQDRAAVTSLRLLLSYHPEMRKDLREMLYNIDQGNAADISGIPDEDMKQSIKKLLKLLGLHKGARKGEYGLGQKDQKTLAVVGFVFDEAPRPAPPPPVARGRDVATPKQPPSPTAPAGNSGTGSSPQAGSRRGGGDAGGPSDSSAPEQGNLPGTLPPLKKEEAGSQETGVYLNGGHEDGPEPAPPARRVMGPAAPTAAMLAAAAASLADLESEEEEEERQRASAYGGYGDDLMVGPPPPEMVLETDAAPQDEREGEVFRIMLVLRKAAADLKEKKEAKIPTPPAQLPIADAYAVLGVTSSASPSEVKKRYMRLSLLIHPDKCGHPDAHEAFQAVSKAAKTLQDSGARQALDAHLEDAELRRLAATEAEKLQRERQWRKALGKETPEDLAGTPLDPFAPIVRETWMTDLPPERSAPAKIDEVCTRTFSKNGFKPRGDTSAWTDTPEQAASKQAGLIGGGSAALLALGPARGIGPGMPISASASALDQYNSQHRRKTLVEEHLERLAKAASGVPDKPAAKPAPVKAATDKAVSTAGPSRDDVSSGGSSDDESNSSSDDGGRAKSSGGSGHKRKRSKDKSERKGKDKDKKSKKHKKHKKESKSDSRKREKRDAEKAAKATAAAAAAVKPAVKADWAGEHPWRPFDRDKDLELKPKAVNPQALINSAAALTAGRFGAAGGTRHFL